MEMRKLSQLMSAINDAIRQSNHVRALRLILNNFAHLRDSAPLRERVALVLAQKGRKKEAVELFELVGRHYANAGFPARAIAAAKQMQRLKPDTTELLDHIATLYNIRSPFLDGLNRTALEQPSTIELDPHEPRLGVDDLLDLASERSMDRKGLAAEPGKLPSVPLLSALPEDTFRQVLNHIEYELFDESQPILELDQSVQELVWTVSDDLVLEQEGEDAYYIPAGALLGLSSFGQAGRGAEVHVATQPGSEVIRLSKEAIQAMTRDTPDFPSRLATLRRHAMTERLITRHPMFRGLDGNQRVAVIEAFTGMRVQRGEVIIQQNTPSPGLFIVLDGEVDIVRQDEDWEITIATLRAGDVFGEIGLVADKPAVAGCVMTQAGHLLHLPRPDFHQLARKYEPIDDYTQRLANERLNEVVLSANDLAEVD